MTKDNTKGPGGPDKRSAPSKRNDTFERKTFRTSRLADFASIPELIKQTGQPPEHWPLVILKELADNGVDDAEEGGTAPEIQIAVTDNSITVADHGRGIAPETVASLVDYSVTTSSRAAYASPTRGQQGNALQSILPMGFALASGSDDADDAIVSVESQGVCHHIRFDVDSVRQTPVVSHLEEPSAVKNGTRITVRWPEQACSLIANAEPGFLQLAERYGWFNPHLTLSADLQTFDPVSWQATDLDWSKWRPSSPTSAHWYDSERLSRLMAAEIAHAEDHGTQCPSVRDFIRQFDGLKGTAKAKDICTEIGVGERTSLRDFHARGGSVIARLLLAMRARSRPVRARDLGVIGRDHLMERMIEDGCDEESFVYRKAEIEHDGLPYVIEVAFGYRGSLDDEDGLRVVEGFNFSPAVGGSPFDLEELLASARVDKDDPVTVFAHLTSPRLNFLDRGKARVAMPPAVAAQVFDLLTAVTAKWTKQKTAEIRNANAYWRRQDKMTRRDKTTIKDAAYAAMPEAYQKASDDGEGGRLPVKPRQIMYAARRRILEMTGRDTFHDDYFTQELLVSFMRDNPELTADWDIIWDDRGHFAEPHTGHEIGLGTLPVRKYIAGFHPPEIVPVGIVDAHVETLGPEERFHAVLFVEKEGFEPIFQAAGLYERYDLAPMSTKGMSTTAGRTLVEELCGKRGLPLFTLHDFDKAGFSIHETLVNDTDRYAFEHELENVVELGLRLADVERLGLASEPVVIRANEKDAARENLRDNGATEDEIAFLIDGDRPQRVELNAMTSRQLVDLVEAGLNEHGVGKVVPPPETLSLTYAALKRGAIARAALEAELERLNAELVDVPDDLAGQVRAYLDEHREETWDDAIKAIMEDD
jgi:DNA topoisomerase VI subunit B